MAETPIVLDGGTGFLKVGYAAQNFPEHQYPSIVGRPILRSEERNGDIVVKDIMCGDEAAAARSMLQITYPVLNLPPAPPYLQWESLRALVADAWLPRWKMAS